jgi:hypothetical protein
MMAKSIYKTGYIKLIDDTEIEISPLKLKYLRQFMDVFELSKNAKTEDELIDYLIDCVRISMKQFLPQIKTLEDVADNFNLPAIYDVLYYCADVKMGHWVEKDNELENTNIPNNQSDKSSWEQLDLTKLESEVFLLGIWKNYDELELNISMPELLLILESKRDLDYQEKKFTAAMQGVDLDEQQPQEQQQDPWEALKARVAAKASGVGSDNPNDITSFQGIRAAQHGFGIGMGLDYATDI